MPLGQKASGLKESTFINNSLLVLGNVISKLSDGKKLALVSFCTQLSTYRITVNYFSGGKFFVVFVVLTQQ